jgi:SSS family solute:Na+ symporter
MIAEYVALSIYLIVLAFITWFSIKKGSDDDFLSASHNVGWKQLSVSFFSSAFSSYNVAVTLTFAFLYGPYVLIIFLGVLGAFYGIYLVSNKYQKEINNISFNNIIDLSVRRYDYKVSTLIHLSLVVILCLFIILQFFINTSIFQQLIGWNEYISSIVVGGIVFLYISVGGLKTEILTDVFQGVLMIIIVALAFMVDTSSITTGTVTSMLSDMTALKAALSLGAVQLLTFLVQPEMWQRVAAARDLENLKKGMIAGWGLLLIVIVPVIAIGMAVNASGIASPGNNLFMDVLNHAAPSWYLPFLLVALFAAFMSTLDSSLFAVASQLGKYGFIVQPSDAEQDDSAADNSPGRRELTENIRATIAVVMVACLAGSLFLGNFLQGVFDLISMMTVVSVSITISMLLSLSSNRTFFIILFGILSYVVILTRGYITSDAITILYPSLVTMIYSIVQEMSLSFYNR